MSKVIIVSGYFNPIHKGHLEYFEKAREHGDKLWVIVNNDIQRELKESKEFQKEEERLTIVKAIRTVDFATLSIDTDRTVIESLKYLNSVYGLEHNLYFANGGDQSNNNIPEAIICKEIGIRLLDKLGNKIQSSSWLLKK